MAKRRDEAASAGEELDLRELFSVLWAGKWAILSATAFAAIISVLIALSLPNIYRAEVLLAVDEEDRSGLAGLASQYGGLASLAGISVPSASSYEKTLAIETLKSRRFISEFIERHGILPELMAGESYDISSKTLSYDGDIYDDARQLWTREVDPPQLPQPSAEEAVAEFRKIFHVNENQDTGFVRVSAEHLSPVIAKDWVTWMVSDINNEMMTQAMNEAQQSIDYLNNQLDETQNVALQRVFYSLIEEQTKITMLASVREEYLFKTIDPAVEMEKRIKPNRALICILGTLLAGFLAVTFAVVRHYAFGPKRGVTQSSGAGE